MPIYSLSVHADYGCRHSGVCCSTDWDVPVEVSIYGRLRDAVERGAIRAERPFLTSPAPPDGAAAILRQQDGVCVFFEHDSHLCAVHSRLGKAALPTTCRLFPRIALTDARGTFVTLSHYCPTAADMLFRDDVPLEIVEGPPAFPTGDYEGLSGIDAWPPLLRPGMLMDLEGYGAWERHVVAVLASPGLDPDDALSTLARDVEQLRLWEGDRSLTDAVGELAASPCRRDPASRLGDTSRLFELAVAATPADMSPAPLPNDVDDAHQDLVAPAWQQFRTPINRLLAAHAFASWFTYQAQGLRAHVRSLEVALAVLRVEITRACMDARRPLDRELCVAGIRAADFVLRHQVDRQMLADACSVAEDEAEHR